MERIVERGRKGFAKVRNGFMRPDSFFGSLSLKHGATIVPIVDLVYIAGVIPFIKSIRYKVNEQDVIVREIFGNHDAIMVLINIYRDFFLFTIALVVLGNIGDVEQLFLPYLIAKVVGVCSSLLVFLYVEIDSLVNRKFQTAWTNFFISGIINFLGIYGLRVMRQRKLGFKSIYTVRQPRYQINSLPDILDEFNDSREIEWWPGLNRNFGSSEYVELAAVRRPSTLADLNREVELHENRESVENGATNETGESVENVEPDENRKSVEKDALNESGGRDGKVEPIGNGESVENGATNENGESVENVKRGENRKSVEKDASNGSGGSDGKVEPIGNGESLEKNELVENVGSVEKGKSVRKDESVEKGKSVGNDESLEKVESIGHGETVEEEVHPFEKVNLTDSSGPDK